MLLNLAGALAIGATIGMILVGVASTAVSQLRHKITLAGIAGAWVGLVASVTASGGLKVIGILLALFILPMLTVVVLSLASSAFRSAVFRIPVPLIIGLNAMRVLGALFLFLLVAGRLGGPFPYSAGIGDIVTGLFALSIAGVAARGSVLNGRVLLWNAFGMLDLIVAVFLGTTSQPGSAIQFIHAGVGSGAIVTLPWAMIPVFLVPFYLVGHGLVFAHARREALSGRSHVELAAVNPGPAVSTT